MSSDDSDEYELHPPSALRVAKRALVLASCACRASLEEAPQHEVALRTWADLQEWIPEIGISEELEPQEAAAIETALGALPPKQRVDLSWQSEGMAVLGWALSRCELPGYDVQVDGPSLGDAIGFLAPDADGLLVNPVLRPPAELEALADTLLTLHWRLREYSLRPRQIDFVAFARSCRWANMRLDGLRCWDGDLVLRGVGLSRAEPEVLAECSSIARERQQAANWLLGTEATYSDVTCDT